MYVSKKSKAGQYEMTTKNILAELLMKTKRMMVYGQKA